jgi:hypothetical protein
MCVHIQYCKWFYPRLLGVEAGPHWWTLWWARRTQLRYVCQCMYASGFIHSSKVWKLFLTGVPRPQLRYVCQCMYASGFIHSSKVCKLFFDRRSKTTARVCVSVHVCAYIAIGFTHGSKVWKLVLTGGPCVGKTTAQVCVSVHVY